jgi:hypothetical protein
MRYAILASLLILVQPASIAAQPAGCARDSRIAANPLLVLAHGANPSLVCTILSDLDRNATTETSAGSTTTRGVGADRPRVPVLPSGLTLSQRDREDLARNPALQMLFERNANAEAIQDLLRRLRDAAGGGGAG